MSGIKPIELTRFYRSLYARGLTISELAAHLNCGRSHLSQVLNGRRTDGHTWRKIARSGVLTTKEMALLGCDVPQETNSHVEQHSAQAQEATTP